MRLSDRQEMVLRAYGDTGSQKIAAETLGISVQTLKNTLSATYEKLGVGNYTMAVRRLGWLTFPDERADEVRNLTAELSKTVTRLDRAQTRMDMIVKRLDDETRWTMARSPRAR